MFSDTGAVIMKDWFHMDQILPQVSINPLTEVAPDQAFGLDDAPVVAMMFRVGRLLYGSLHRGARPRSCSSAARIAKVPIGTGDNPRRREARLVSESATATASASSLTEHIACNQNHQRVLAHHQPDAQLLRVPGTDGALGLTAFRGMLEPGIDKLVPVFQVAPVRAAEMDFQGQDNSDACFMCCRSNGTGQCQKSKCGIARSPRASNIRRSGLSAPTLPAGDAAEWALVQ